MARRVLALNKEGFLSVADNRAQAVVEATESLLHRHLIGALRIFAGSMEGYLLILAGDWMWWQMVSQFMAPVLIGNIVGGTALFALIAYAQVMDEI